MEIKSIKKEWNATILDILKAFMEICKTHNLRYYCRAGTAIGAARHHGMIPWDDDIGVLMPRPDYDRLLEIAKKEDFGKYEVVTPYNNESYRSTSPNLSFGKPPSSRRKNVLASSDSMWIFSHWMLRMMI